MIKYESMQNKYYYNKKDVENIVKFIKNENYYNSANCTKEKVGHLIDKVNYFLDNITIKKLFDNYLDNLDYFFMYLSEYYGTKLYSRNSLFIFDEIQFCPRARGAIKHSVKDHRYDYIETGALISIKKNVKDILIPSEEEKNTDASNGLL